MINLTLEETIKGLEYIAESPDKEHGGFHEATIETAKAALHYLSISAHAVLAKVRAEMLHDAIGLLMNHEQHCEMDWIEDYEALIAKYNEHFA